MKMLLVYSRFEAKRNEFLIEQFKEVCKLKNLQFNLLIEEDFDEKCFEELTNNKPDFVVFRTVNEWLRQKLSEIAPIFNNNKVSEIANDKWKAIRLASSLEIPTPKTQFFEFCEKPSLPKTFPVVVKPTDGKGGKNVFLVNDEKQFNDAVNQIGKHNYVVQQPMDLGRDMRVYVIGQKIITSILRKSDVDFRANFCLGGEACLIKQSKKVEDYVHLLATALQSDFIGIDFMFSNSEPIFNEIEDVVGSRMIYAKTNLNPVLLYIEHILSKLS